MNPIQQSKPVEGALWLWVAAAFAAFLYQFRELIGPILTVLKDACRNSLPFC